MAVSGRIRRSVELAIVLAAMMAGTVAAGSDDGPAAPSITPWLDTSDRATVVAAYDAEFSGPPPVLAWVGDSQACEAGSSSAAHREATVRRVNFYRAMAGVQADVVEEPSFSDKAQRAAMMMSAEGELTHTPDDSFACFSAVGQEAAANSNLYLGRNGPRAVDGYIEDPGEGNNDVGHRTTILHPPTRLIGVGDVDATERGSAANALWVFDDRVFDEESPTLQPPMREPDRFAAWPPRGYVPAELVHPRWSFTASGIDVSEAEVTLHRPAAPEGDRTIPLQVVNRSGAPGHVPLPTIVWEPEIGLDPTSPPLHDELYLVVITGVGMTADEPAPATVATSTGDGPEEMRSFAYEVRILGDRVGSERTIAEFLDRLAAEPTP